MIGDSDVLIETLLLRLYLIGRQSTRTYSLCTLSGASQIEHGKTLVSQQGYEQEQWPMASGSTTPPVLSDLSKVAGEFA